MYYIFNNFNKIYLERGKGWKIITILAVLNLFCLPKFNSFPTRFEPFGKTNYKKSIVFLKKIKKIFNIKNGITNKQILGIKSAGKIW